jgi:hypothetical protein
VSLDVHVSTYDGPNGHALRWQASGGVLVADLPRPVIVESVDANGQERRLETGYADVRWDGDVLTGHVDLGDGTGARYAIADRWSPAGDGRWRVQRSLRVLHATDGGAVRLVLEVAPRAADGDRFGDWTCFAPGAMYDLNDLDGDLVDDYADTQTLVYREDRLTVMSVLAFHRGVGLAVSLSRADRPMFDSVPDRVTGQTAVRQRTDIGSLGVFPGRSAGAGCILTSAYPFVERERSHALLVGERPGWGAYWPVSDSAQEVITVDYLLAIDEAATPHDALWQLWRQRMTDLEPVPVTLPAPLADITRYRVDALRAYYAEDPGTGAAGFVTNCHPQDGAQLRNVVQYGFTGQNLLNAACLLRAGGTHDERAENRRRAVKVIDFYVEDAQRNEHGLVHGLYNMDRRSYGSWWTGLLLPLAYAEPGDDLEQLMGPLYDHLRPVIDALRGREGTYLRCLAEEYASLLMSYELEHAAGHPHPEWLSAAQQFGRFLLSVQRADGAFHRAYALDGGPLTEPDFWFGQTDLQQTSSTATVVPFLLGLHRITGDGDLLAAAVRATEYADRVFVEGLKFNGGIHDSMYARPQLVDHESIIFAFRALLELHGVTGEERYLRQAVRAAWIACSWAFLWDVPLPAGSTFGREGFRSTGWTGCDTPGAGYIHPMGVVMVPDLVEVGRLSGEPLFLEIAELVLAGCNENVALPGRDWGYARPGLQEEGLQISWCWIDDPMFAGTGFGGRGKGEGNKTCFPWISAVAIWAHQELMHRYGTDDVAALAPSAPEPGARLGGLVGQPVQVGVAYRGVGLEGWYAAIAVVDVSALLQCCGLLGPVMGAEGQVQRLDVNGCPGRALVAEAC